MGEPELAGARPAVPGHEVGSLRLPGQRGDGLIHRRDHGRDSGTGGEERGFDLGDHAAGADHAARVTGGLAGTSDPTGMAELYRGQVTGGTHLSDPAGAVEPRVAGTPAFGGPGAPRGDASHITGR